MIFRPFMAHRNKFAFSENTRSLSVKPERAFSTVGVRPATTVGAAKPRHVVPTEEDLTESHPEVGTEDRVDDRIE